MAKTHKKWSQEQKLAILEECKTSGVAATCRKYGIAESLPYKWREKIEIGGADALVSYKRQASLELKQLEDENRRLKQLVADKELELQMHKELLKKKIAEQRAKGK